MPNMIQKAEDTAKALSSLSEIVGKLKEQASQGQVDGALIDQAGAVLNVAMDTASDPHSSNASEASTAAGSDVSMPSVPAPSGVSKGEGESTPTEDSNPSEESTAPSEESSEMSIPTSDVNKGELPLEGRPPMRNTAPNLIFDGEEEYRRILPGFVKALESGSMKAAQKIAGNSQYAFDTLFNMGMRAVLTEGGWTTGNMSKLGGYAAVDPANLAKSFTASSVPGVYLIRLAKMMLPVYAGLTNRLPSQSPQGMSSNQATWKAQLGFGSLPEVTTFRVAEAATGASVPTSFLTYNAPFNDIAYTDGVTLKAIAAGRGYSDPLQLSVIKTMSAVLRTQERIVLGSSGSPIGDVGAITSGSTTGGTWAAGSFVIGVTALTYEGYLGWSQGGSSTYGESAVTVSGSNSITAVILAAGQALTASWAAVPGAWAYNIYTGPTNVYAGSALTYNKTVYTNSITIAGSSLTTTAAPALTNVTANSTYGIEGLGVWCMRNGVYGNATPNKVSIYDNAGAGFTAANGGIKQIDTILASMWSTWQTAPSVMLMSPNMNASLVGKLLSSPSTSTYRIEVSQERGTINGGMMITGYTNKFAPFADGTPRYIDIIPHPYMPDGTVLIASETIPYPMGNETRGFVREVLLPYTYFPLASSTLQYNYSIETSETLECFNPGPQSAIVGVDYTA